jgi:hypothetical protein
VYRYPTDIASRDPRTRGDRHSIPLPRPLLLQRPDDLSQEDRLPRPRRPGEKDRPALVDDHVEHVALFRGEDDFLPDVEGGVGVSASGGGQGWEGDFGSRARHIKGCRISIAITTGQNASCETHVKLLGSQGINPDPDADPATEGVPPLSKPLFAPTPLVLVLVLAVALTPPPALLPDPVPAPAGSSGTLHPAPTGKLDIETEATLELAPRPAGALEEDPFIAANIAARLFSFARAISSGVCGFRLYVCDCGLVVGVVERDEREADL